MCICLKAVRKWDCVFRGFVRVCTVRCFSSSSSGCSLESSFHCSSCFISYALRAMERESISSSYTHKTTEVTKHENNYTLLFCPNTKTKQKRTQEVDEMKRTSYPHLQRDNKAMTRYQGLLGWHVSSQFESETYTHTLTTESEFSICRRKSNRAERTTGESLVKTLISLFIKDTTAVLCFFMELKHTHAHTQTVKHRWTFNFCAPWWWCCASTSETNTDSLRWGAAAGNTDRINNTHTIPFKSRFLSVRLTDFQHFSCLTYETLNLNKSHGF